MVAWIGIALDLVVVGLSAYFWPHCARPALIYGKAGRIAYRLVLFQTIFTVVAFCALAVARFAGANSGWQLSVQFASSGVVGVAWLLIVGLGYPEYRVLKRVTRRFD